MEKPNYQIFRIAKVKRQGVGGIQQEHNRTEKDVGRFLNSEIDYSKTYQNEYFVKSENYWSDVKQILHEHGIEKWRKDAIVMNDAFFSFSPEVMNVLSENARMQYFKECMKWYEDNFGKALNCVVHKDETTWHMHINSVPLVQKEDGTWKLSAKDQYGNKSKMAAFQTDLHQKVGRRYGLERGESRTPDEQRKHKTKLEHDIEKLMEKINTISGWLETAQQEFVNYKGTLDIKKKEAYDLLVQELRQTKAELTKGVDEELQIQKEELHNTLESVQKAKNELQHIEELVKAYANHKEPLEYKKAPLNKGMYLVPEEIILDYNNMHIYASQINKKNREADKKLEKAELELLEAKAMKHRTEKVTEREKEVTIREQNLEAYANQKAKEQVNKQVGRIADALGKTTAQLFSLVQQAEREQERHHHHSLSR